MNKACWDEDDWNDYDEIARNNEKIPAQAELSTWGVGLDETFGEEWCI